MWHNYVMFVIKIKTTALRVSLNKFAKIKAKFNIVDQNTAEY